VSKAIFLKRFLFWSLKLTMKVAEVPATVAFLPPAAAVQVAAVALPLLAAAVPVAVVELPLLEAAVQVREPAPAQAVVTAGAASSVYCSIAGIEKGWSWCC
jgi:hypothetical protein